MHKLEQVSKQGLCGILDCVYWSGWCLSRSLVLFHFINLSTFKRLEMYR